MPNSHDPKSRDGTERDVEALGHYQKKLNHNSPAPHAGVTEEMVEAGARVIAECARTGIIKAPKLDWPCWMGISRAILTAALASRPASAVGEEELYERINVLEDLLGTVSAHLTGDRGYENARPAIIGDIAAYFEDRKSSRTLISAREKP